MSQPKRERLFLESPDDIETVFAAMKLAETHEKQAVFMDLLIAHIRLDSICDLTSVCYMILRQIGLMKMENFFTP